VEGVEPSEEMIAIARERIASATRHYRLASPPRVTFHATSLEDCALPDESFDAALFHAALHHVVDENRALSQCFRLLRPGGVLGVSEAAWIPGDRELEEQLEEEMRRYGTLENPFTPEYLDRLLRQHGFIEVCRYHSVNGYFPARMGRLRLDQVAGMTAPTHNNLTARKPSPYPLTTADFDARTLAEITVLDRRFEPAAGQLHLPSSGAAGEPGRDRLAAPRSTGGLGLGLAALGRAGRSRVPGSGIPAPSAAHGAGRRIHRARSGLPHPAWARNGPLVSRPRERGDVLVLRARHPSRKGEAAGIPYRNGTAPSRYLMLSSFQRMPPPRKTESFSRKSSYPPTR
jgi:hypothetical protein